MKYAFIRNHAAEHPVTLLCQTLGVSRSGYYDWKRRKPGVRQQANSRLLDEIREIHVDVMETYGSPRMHVELRERGHQVSRGRIERLMRTHGIQAKQSKRHKRTYTHRQTQEAEVNHLGRQFHAIAPNEKWVSDITFIPTREGWLYLAIVLDLFSRAIVGWAMHHRPDGQLVRDALAMAIQSRERPRKTLVHSDQGSQYTAAAYRADLAARAMTCSMSRKGECHDNAVAESFFHTLKNELVHEADFRNRSEARQAIFKYIELFYNRKRRHSYLNFVAPLQYEKMMACA